METNTNSKVKAYVQLTPIPTYELSEPNSLPMFLDKRVYQGSSGKIYPYPLTEKISGKKTIREYNAVYLENEYLLVMLLPEIGGRVQRIYDKANERDCVYYNEVIKPAFAGLTGPWISGGIEFNCPQHHRPASFEHADFFVEEKEDGSAEVHVSEIDKIYHIKAMTSFVLHPGKAYLEVKCRLYNTTGQTKTFLWWADAAVPANENTISVFPPDVHAVADHGMRAVSKFPVATDSYYKADYGEGVDISRAANIPVPTSFAAYRSNYDFLGSYDSAAEAGFLHIADHHISPGKRQWTWGSGNFGKAWYDSLTDENGPYIELCAGVFADRQPGFSFLAPYEEKSFTQYFMPYKSIGAVKNATIYAAVNLETDEDGKTSVKVCAPSEINAEITLKGKLNKYISEKAVISPSQIYECTADTENEDPCDLTVTVTDENNRLLVSYQPEKYTFEPLPKPAKAPGAPEDIASLEELYLTAVHLEQYHHASFSPEPYYLEGLKRDPTDIRLNNGYGKYLYNMGLFEESEKYFRAAIKKSMLRNPNPYDCEPFYNLGMSLKEQGKFDEAYDAFYRSIWSAAMQDCGFYQLACIASAQGRPEEALAFVEQSLVKGYHNLKARTLKTALLRHLGKTEQAEAFARETLDFDPMSYGARYELYRLTNDFNELNTLTTIMQNDLQSYIELSIKYSEAGLFEDAAKVLALISQADRRMLHYYTAYYSNSAIELEIAKKCDDPYDFPSRLHDIKVLEYAIKNSPSDARAPYDLANLLYDKGQWQRAIALWEDSAKLDHTHAEIYRNLAAAYFNKLHDSEKAIRNMEKAAALAPGNARIFYELDCLRKETNYPILKRANAMAADMQLTSSRDDLYTECITLVNTLGKYDRALKLINMHDFRPWEGAEGKITAQYRAAHIGLARAAIEAQDTEDAAEHLNAALSYPENLGEGKLPGALDCDIYYYLGCALESTDKIQSNEYFEKATRGETSPEPAVYYNDRPPEMFFYQALAFEKLGNVKKAKSMYNKLIDYAEEHMNDVCRPDYFAVSLPEFLIFDTDLEKKHRLHCIFMAALGHTGFGRTEKALRYVEAGLKLDNAHQGLNILKRTLTGGEKQSRPEVIKRNYVWRK